MRRRPFPTLALLALAATPAAAQVSVPRSGTLNNAQPVFCVNPTTGAVEDCVASGSGASNPAAGATGAAVPADASYGGLNVGGLLKGWVGDSNGGGLVAGEGTAGTPAGGVLSIQGVGSGTPVPVSGTFWQATQPVSGTFWQTTQPVSLASAPTTPVTGTFWQTTQPVSIASLPSGAVTQGTSPWIVAGAGTAGTPGTAVLTVQGIASGTAQPVSATSLPLPTGAMGSTGGTVGLVAGSANIGHVDGEGTAGTPSGGVLTVQGSASGTGLPVTIASLPSGAVTNAGTFAVQAAESGAWTNTVTQATGTNLHVVVDTAPTTAVTIATAPALVASSAIIGNVRIDQTTPGATNGTQDAADGATGSAVPAKAAYAGAVSSGNLTGLIQADHSAAINVSTATTTQLVALTSGKAIYVTHWDVVVAAADNVTLEYGTGTACATGTTALTGAYNLPANGGVSAGVGLAPVLFVPVGDALCVLTSAATQASGAVAYTQF